MLTPLTGKRAIATTMKRLADSLRMGCRKRHCVIGGPGWSFECDVYWEPRSDLWWRVFPRAGRFLNCFGLGEPVGHKSVIVEINPPTKGVNLRCAGCFLKDDAGRAYLAHSGKVGGGRLGIGKARFLKFCDDEPQPVTLPDGETTEMLVLGAIGSPKLRARIALFTRGVERFKQAAVSGKGARAARLAAQEFSPEFSGTRKTYRVRGEIEGRCDHGLVVNKLREQIALLRPKWHVFNDARDLYAKSGRAKVLFEVKTETTTSAVYQAVGQLMLHGYSEKTPPRLVMVVPDCPANETSRVLERLGITVVQWEWRKDGVSFRRLGSVLPR